MHTLRKATAEDYDFLYSLHRTTMREYIEATWGWHEEWQEEYFRRKYDPAKRRIIQVDGRDVGVVVVEERNDELYLGLIEILPDYQRQGIGTAVVESLKAKGKTLGRPVTLHVLKTNLPARQLYRRLGFQIVEEEEVRYKMAWTPGP